MPIAQPPVAYRVLGQLQLSSASSWELLYTPTDPASIGSYTRCDAVCSTLTICNLSPNTEEFYVAVVPGGGTPTNPNIVYNQVKIASNDTFAATFGITLYRDTGVADEIYVQASSTDVVFSLFGSEILTTP